jgi:hypothetical protein
MKTRLISIVIFSGCLLAGAQQTGLINHSSGQSILSFTPTVLINTPNGVQLAAGAKYQLFISRRFSLDADVVFSKDYAHLSPAAIGVPFALLYFSSDEPVYDKESLFLFLISIAAIAVSVEHISYHIPVTQDLDISPFFSLLRYKYAYDYEKALNPDFVTDQLSFAAGLQINRYFGRFVFSPYTEYNVGYKDGLSGINAGIYFGIYFYGRRTK